MKLTTDKIVYFTKFIFFICFFVNAATSLNAQINACGCTPLTTYGSFVWIVSCTGAATPSNNDCPIGTDPVDYVIINWERVQCGTNMGIRFINAIGVGPGFKCNNPGPYTTSNPCISTYNFQTQYRNAQQAALIHIGVGTANMSYVYPAGCQTIAEVTYPNPSKCYWFHPECPKKGVISLSINLGATPPILELLPCDGDNCCVLEYTFNSSTGRYNLITFNPILSCPILPPSITTKEFTCLDFNGQPITYTGTVTFPNGCVSYCDAALNTLYKTSGTNEFKPFPNSFDFNITPTLAH